MANSLGEGKLCIQTSCTQFKIDFVFHPAHGEGIG